ncbi:MAG: hypothetical protein IH614_05955 [Desulfuromonadales bacterium]|nr:hypothetical protein [Desulfuromonadales bacterium]
MSDPLVCPHCGRPFQKRDFFALGQVPAFHLRCRHCRRQAKIRPTLCIQGFLLMVGLTASFGFLGIYFVGFFNSDLPAGIAFVTGLLLGGMVGSQLGVRYLVASIHEEGWSKR